MAILVDSDTRVICQGLTGAFGAAHTKGCLDYGTQMVGGVTPGKGGQKDANDLPIFNTCHDAVRAVAPDATMIFVPAPFAADAAMEAADAGIRLIVLVTEGIPALDMVKARPYLAQKGARLIGPNCPGIITPGGDGSPIGKGCKIGIMPGYIHQPVDGRRPTVGVVSRSGTLTYEAVWQTTQAGFAQTTCVGIGGDPVKGLNFVEILEMFQHDSATQSIILIGEIGGQDENEAAEYVQAKVTKPVVGYIAGQTAPPGRRMGHAGAIVGGANDTAEAKIAALRAAGIAVADSPADIGKTLREVASPAR